MTTNDNDSTRVTRRATVADGDAVASVMIDSRAAAPIPPSVHSPSDVRRWVTDVLIRDCEVWLVEQAASIVAVLAMSEGWIEQLYVLPAFSGQGIGGDLVELAKRRHPLQLQLWTFVSNEPAQRFYENRGFTEVERTDGGANEEREPDIRYVWSGAAAGLTGTS